MLSTVQANPFRQASSYVMVRLFVPRDYVSLVEESFSDLCISVSSFEVQERPQLWKVEMVMEGPVNESEIHSRVLVLKEVMGIDLAPPECEPVVAKDWASEVIRLFPPLHIGRFFVYGSHFKEALPAACIPLLVDAGAAFGSGEHGTTSGCLLALEYVMKRRSLHNALDMGCGSGILALGYAKALRRRAIAIDLDMVSVKVTRANAGINRVPAFIRAYAEDGYKGTVVKRHGPFDLIFANILARPLTKMAPSLARSLKPGGFAILSGLLIDQEQMVLAAHRAQHVKLVKKWHREGWSTLLLQR